MRDVQASVIGISHDTTKSGKSRWDIDLSNGEKVTAWEVDIATRAQATAGATATFRIEDKPSAKGDRVYKNLKDVLAAGQAAPQVAPTPGTPLGASVVAPNATAGVIPITEAPKRENGSQGFTGMSPERETKIVKQSSISSASTLLGAWIQANASDPVQFDELGAWTIELAKVFFNEVMGQPKIETPAQVAAVVPGVAVGTAAVVTEPATTTLPWN